MSKLEAITALTILSWTSSPSSPCVAGSRTKDLRWTTQNLKAVQGLRAGPNQSQLQGEAVSFLKNIACQQLFPKYFSSKHKKVPFPDTPHHFLSGRIPFNLPLTFTLLLASSASSSTTSEVFWMQSNQDSMPQPDAGMAFASSVIPTSY